MPSFQLSSPLHETDAEVLAIHCSDHRFQAGFYEFLNLKLNLDENYDLLVLPGGPQCLTLVEYLPKFSWAGWKWFRYLVDSHDLKRLILIQHQDCRWYKALPLHLHSSTGAARAPGRRPAARAGNPCQRAAGAERRTLLRRL